MSAPKLTVAIAFASDKGVKDENQDFVGSLIPEDHQLAYKGIAVAIADGMSGCDAGKEASHCCVAAFLDDYFSTPDSWSVKHAGQKILSATNSWLYSQGQRSYDATHGMVSTLSAMILKSNTVHLFHVGDSRIYRLRAGNLEQLTRDHRIWAGNERNYLNRAMGIEPRLEVDYQALPMQVGDVFLMTTDGVHDFVDDKALKKTLLEQSDLQNAADALIALAAQNHSDDNLSCQLLRVEALPALKEDEVLRRQSQLPFPPPLSPGMVLDRYRIEAEMHASKRTQIYRAFDLENGTQVILKTPSVLYEDDTHYIEHFLHEEWAGKRIRSEHVVKTLGADREKSCLYYVTEFLEGPTLAEWMRAHPKPEVREVRKIVEQIALGLRAFHRMEMLHQDLKPENIMFDLNGALKIIDFGSVKIAGITEMTPLDHGTPENVLGTLNYTAPEYHLGRRGTVKSDLFSLGVIAYEMLNGALPFGRSMPEKPNKNNLDKLRYVPSLQCNPMVPVWIDGALKKATSIQPEFRYEDLPEFLYDLSTPNPTFLTAEEAMPLMQRNPLLVWKTLALLLLLSNLATLYWLLKA